MEDKTNITLVTYEEACLFPETQSSLNYYLSNGGHHINTQPGKYTAGVDPYSYPMLPHECLEFNDSAEIATENLSNIKICGFTYEELKARGASDESIEFMMEKELLKKEHPNSELELVTGPDGKKAWLIKNQPMESYRFDIFEIGSLNPYTNVTKTQIEETVKGAFNIPKS